MKGAFARGQEAWGIVFEAFAGCKGRGGAGACGIVFGAFAGRKGRLQGRGALFLGRSQGQEEFAGSKERVYDFSQQT